MGTISVPRANRCQMIPSSGREHFWSKDQQWKTYIPHLSRKIVREGSTSLEKSDKTEKTKRAGGRHVTAGSSKGSTPLEKPEKTEKTKRARRRPRGKTISYKQKTRKKWKNDKSPPQNWGDNQKTQTTNRRQSVPTQLGETSNRLSKITHESPHKNENKLYN